MPDVTPHGVPFDMDAPSCTESPFVEGCSPIRSCSPLPLHHEPQHHARSKPRPRFRCWASPPLISPILNPRLQDSQEAEGQLPSSLSSSSTLPSMDLDRSSPLLQPVHTADSASVSLDSMKSVDVQKGKEDQMDEDLEEEEEVENTGPSSPQLTSSRMGNVSTTESSQMFVSVLTEGSSLRYDSSMQVRLSNSFSPGVGNL